MKKDESLNGRVPVKIGKETLLFPTGWHHITLAQILLIYNPATGPKSILDILSVLTGKPIEFWFRVDRMDIDRILLPHLTWFHKPMDFNALPKPPFVPIDGKNLKVPKDLGFESFGQKISFAQELTNTQEANKDATESIRNYQLVFGLIPYTLALYFYQQYHGVSFADKFDEEAIREFANTKIMQIPITFAYPVATFFLRK